MYHQEMGLNFEQLMFGLLAWIQRIHCLYYIDLMILEHGKTKHILYLHLFLPSSVENDPADMPNTKLYFP